MPSFARLQWLRSQLFHGRGGLATASQVKVKVVLHSGSLPDHRQPCVFHFAVLDSLERAILGGNCVVIDKGRKESSGRSIVEFGVRRVPGSSLGLEGHAGYDGDGPRDRRDRNNDEHDEHDWVVGGADDGADTTVVCDRGSTGGVLDSTSPICAGVLSTGTVAIDVTALDVADYERECFGSLDSDCTSGDDLPSNVVADVFPVERAPCDPDRTLVDQETVGDAVESGTVIADVAAVSQLPSEPDAGALPDLLQEAMASLSRAKALDKCARLTPLSSVMEALRADGHRAYDGRGDYA